MSQKGLEKQDSNSGGDYAGEEFCGDLHEFAGCIAHQFNNIMQSILGSVSLARVKARAGSGIEELLSEAEEGCRRAEAYSRRLLAFSKGEPFAESEILYADKDEKLEEGLEVREEPRRKRVLLMDDDESVRNVAGRMLTLMGHEVSFAREGSEAIEMYKDALDSGSPYSLVIMDLTIEEGLSGKVAAKELKKLDPGAKVILSSGYSNDRFMRDYKKFGFSGTVAKPYNIHQLNSIIEAVL